MTVSVEIKEEEMGSLPIKPEDPSSYGCQILQEKQLLKLRMISHSLMMPD